jgi:hypothetical protein
VAEERRGTERYPLAAVRDVRARDEHGKRGELAIAVGDARVVRAKLDAARSHTTAAREALTAAHTVRETLIASGASASRIVSAELFVRRRRRELEAALGEQLRCEAASGVQQGALDIARERLARARADRELIERHFERWHTARKQLAARRED